MNAVSRFAMPSLESEHRHSLRTSRSLTDEPLQSLTFEQLGLFDWIKRDANSDSEW